MQHHISTPFYCKEWETHYSLIRMQIFLVINQFQVDVASRDVNHECRRVVRL